MKRSSKADVRKYNPNMIVPRKNEIKAVSFPIFMCCSVVIFFSNKCWLCSFFQNENSLIQKITQFPIKIPGSLNRVILSPPPLGGGWSLALVRVDTNQGDENNKRKLTSFAIIIFPKHFITICRNVFITLFKI